MQIVLHTVALIVLAVLSFLMWFAIGGVFMASLPRDRYAAFMQWSARKPAGEGLWIMICWPYWVRVLR